jgi:signal transduction histidine kinase
LPLTLPANPSTRRSDTEPGRIRRCRRGDVSAIVDVRAATGRSGRRQRLEIIVSDAGPGVAPEARTSLFLPFARSGDAAAGSGLGLATAAAAIRAHGGEIGYRDGPSGGATFWFRVLA